MSADLREQFFRLSRFATAQRNEWAGIPMPLEGLKLTVEPSYPLAHILNTEPKTSDTQDFELVNRFYSSRLRSDLCFIKDPDGKRDIVSVPVGTHSLMQLHTLAACDAWDVDTEIRACQKLHGLIGDLKYKRYLLCGIFLETSPRSQVTYLFRKLRPTLALRPDPKTDEMRILAALCLHPIAYYDGSWAGAMCPTDDLLAHLLLMRGDEPMFWRRANQHPAYRPEAGL